MCGSTCIRYTMVILNALLALLGVVFTGFGIYYILEVVSNNWERYFVLTVIALGLIVIFTASCGCVGALRESYSLLVTHTFFMFLLMSLSTAGVVVILVYKAKFANLIVPLLGDMHYCNMVNSYCVRSIELKVEDIGNVLIIIALFKATMVLFGGFVSCVVRTEKRRLS